ARGGGGGGGGPISPPPGASAGPAAGRAPPHVRDRPLAERTAALFGAYAAFVSGDPRRIRITFVEIIGVSPRLAEQRLARRSRWVDLSCAEAETAAAHREAAPRDYRIAATAFIGGVNGLLHDGNAGWVHATLDVVVDELVGRLLAILRPRDGTPPTD
ncbi:hypothetical protein ACIO13_26130, partial [Streptomyces sp. NPDC087425]